MEAMRCLKRRLSDAVYPQLLLDQRPADSHTATNHQPTVDLPDDPPDDADPRGHSRATLSSNVADLPPHVGTSDQPQPRSPRSGSAGNNGSSNTHSSSVSSCRRDTLVQLPNQAGCPKLCRQPLGVDEVRVWSVVTALRKSRCVAGALAGFRGGSAAVSPCSGRCPAWWELPTIRAVGSRSRSCVRGVIKNHRTNKKI
jgi:hypothetical protein